MKRFLFLILALPLAAVETVPALRPEQARRLNELQALAAEKPAEALARAEQVPAAERDAALWRWIGDRHALADQSTTALAAYTEALKALPTYRDVLLNHAQLSLAATNAAPALALLQEALRQGLADAQVYEALGALADASQDPALAESAYRQALLLNAESPYAREALAGLLLQQRRYPEAAALTEHLLAQRPDAIGLWRLHADLAQALGQSDIAAQRLETAHRLGLAEASDLRRLAELYVYTGLPAEIPRLLAASPGMTDDADFLPRLLEALLDAGEHDLADTILGQRSLPPGARADRIHARRLLAKGQAEAAAKALDASLKEHPTDPDTLRLAGEAWQAAGNPDEAVQRFARLARQAGHAARGLWRQGLVEAQRGKIAEAIELLEAARRHQDLPGLSQTLDRLRELR